MRIARYLLLSGVSSRKIFLLPVELSPSWFSGSNIGRLNSGPFPLCDFSDVPLSLPESVRLLSLHPLSPMTRSIAFMCVADILTTGAFPADVCSVALFRSCTFPFAYGLKGGQSGRGDLDGSEFSASLSAHKQAGSSAVRWFRHWCCRTYCGGPDHLEGTSRSTCRSDPS